MSGKRLIEEDLFSRYSIVDNNTVEGQRIHTFLFERAKKLASKSIDFNANPVTFVLSDDETPNAFFCDIFNPEKAPRPSEYQTPRYVRNHLETPVIAITAGLIDMVESLDELDYVLGHELTHMLMRGYGIKHNSKGEEEIADVHAVDLVYDAGGDPKQALAMTEKFSIYAKEKEEENEVIDRRYRNTEDEGINWSEILDVHMTRGNRKAGIEASLTRLSHLIDDRKPTPIDKSIFDAHYKDPVDVFLEDHNYKKQKVLGKLKILIDCVTHISSSIPAKEFFDNELTSLPKNPDEFDWKTTERQKAIQKRIDSGYKGYFHGPTVEKKYQQKIARLAEKAINETKDCREKGGPNKPVAVNTSDLIVYLEDKAYEHIMDHGYPIASDYNYEQAAGILYSYFYCLLESNSPVNHRSRRSRNMFSDESFETKRVRSRAETDLNDVKDAIRKTDNFDEFIASVLKFKKITNTIYEVRSIEYGPHNSYEKLDNLSGIKSYGSRFDQDIKIKQIYPALESEALVPWNNLYSIAQSDDDAKENVVAFLKDHNLTDYRITHGIPYVQFGRNDGYKIDTNGMTSKDNVPAYQISYEIHKDTITAVYNYIRKYFDDEGTLIEKTCLDVLGMTNQDYKEPDETRPDKTIANKKIYDFLSMFNALPDVNQADDEIVIQMIPEHYLENNMMPGSRKSKSSFGSNIIHDFDTNLLKFNNSIFQSHFGKTYQEELMEKKKRQHDKMFEAALVLFQQSIDNSADSREKISILEAQEEQYWKEVERSGENRWDHKRSDRIQNIQIEKAFHKERFDQAESIIYNFIDSIFEDNKKYWYNLQRLTPEQSAILANYVVRDEKREIKKTVQSERYEYVCDFLDILEHQLDQVVQGNYSLTSMMQIVANNHNYTQPKTNEDRIQLVEKTMDAKYGRDESQYLWYLQMFDAMSVLETGRSIDVRSVATMLSEICGDKSHKDNTSYNITIKRGENLSKFLKQSKVLKLVSQAIAQQENYSNLSFENMMLTVDSLIDLKETLRPRLEKHKDDEIVDNKSYLEPQHKALFDTIDDNVCNLLRRGEATALVNPDRLQAMEQLYKIYNEYNKYSTSDLKRTSYLDVLIGDEKRLEKLSQLAKDENFWPDNALDHIKAYVFAKNTFLDDKEFENELLNNILDKVDALAPSKAKNSCLHILLDKNLRAPYPDTRERVFEIYTNDVHDKLGYDDTSEKYENRLALYLKSFDVSDIKEERRRKLKYKKSWDIGHDHGRCNCLLSNQISSADKYILLRKLADKIVSQEETSRILKEACQINLESDDMLRSYLYGIGVDYLTEEMDRDSDTASRFVKFLNSKGESKECKEISSHIQARAELRLREYPNRLKDIKRNTQPSNFSILYQNFWSAPLEARAVIIARMLKSAVAEQDGEAQTNQQSWERVFDVVMDNLISTDDESVEARYSRETMHSYIKAKNDYERELILSAMMVANRNLGGETGNIGKGLRFFLENSGPAEIKAGQAGGSHPNTPTQIATELQELKNNANTPARWTIYDWIKDYNIPEEYWKDQNLGKVRAASYFATIELGDDEILRLLVPEAREKAKKGFRVLGDTIEDLEEKDAVSDLDFGELTTSVQQMITQASKMSDIETNLEIGAKQCVDVKEICDGVKITSGAQVFDIKVMDWSVKGNDWCKMKRAKGPTFNELPETTPQEITYKKDFAKGYITFQIGNILSGGKFDHDTHGANLCVDPQTNTVGLFDTGAMALNDPTHEEQRLLGHVLYDAIKLTLSGEKSFTVFSRSISDKIDELHTQGIDTKYLVEVKKEILALGDFFKVLDQSDIKEIMPGLSIIDDIAEPIKDGIFERMTKIEKASLNALSATSAFKQNNNAVVIDRNNTGISTAQNVVEVNIAPTVKDKAAWLGQTFTGSKDGKGKSRPSSLVKLRA